MPDTRRMARLVAQDLQRAGYAQHRPRRWWLSWLMPGRAGWTLETFGGDHSAIFVYFCGGGDIALEEGGPEMRAAVDRYCRTLTKCGWTANQVGGHYVVIWGRP